VPLLSVAIIETLPSVSIIDNFLTNTPFCAKRCPANANANVTVAGKPSGMAATIIPKASRNESNSPIPTSNRPTTKTIVPIPIATTAMMRVTRSNSSCRGLGSSFITWVSLAILPNWVSIPVANMMAFPVPDTTEVPAKIRFGRSISLIPSRREASADFLTGNASPVKLALFTLNPYSSTTRASAGILSPSDKINKSPGTRSLAEIFTSTPSLMTRAVSGKIFFKLAMACSVR